MNESLANEIQESNNNEPDDYESFSEVSVSDDDEQKLPPVDNASIITELPAQTPNIIEIRDSLLQQKDNLVIFITLDSRHERLTSYFIRTPFSGRRILPLYY